MSDHDTFYIETDIIVPKKGFINVLKWIFLQVKVKVKPKMFDKQRILNLITI